MNQQTLSHPQSTDTHSCPSEAVQVVGCTCSVLFQLSSVVSRQAQVTVDKPLMQTAARQPNQIWKHLLQACGRGLLALRWQCGSHKDVLPLKLPAQTWDPQLTIWDYNVHIHANTTDEGTVPVV